MRSEVADFYIGKSLFITGGTGFMGKVLIEKLLYQCPGLTTLYVLMRSKRGKSIESRLEAMFELPLFFRVKKECPEQFKKVVPIEGDVGVNGLGMSKEDKQKLIDNVNIVIHNAASLRLDAKLIDAINMNTEGTYRILELSTEMKKLQLMMHTSTAFCHCDVDVMEEKVYPSPHDPMDIIRISHWMEPKTLERITPDIIKPHPNVYTYTKRISEALVASYHSKIPVCIVRPSIVTPAHKEPLPGWVDNLNGPVGLLVGGGKGAIRSMHCNGDLNAEVIPVDMAISGIVAIARAACLDLSKREEVPVFNLTQSGAYPVTWGEVVERGKVCCWDNPFEVMLWYPNGEIYKSKAIHDLNVIFFHWLPAYFIDFLLFIFGQKTFMLRVQRKIQDGLNVLQYFTTKEWKFPNDRLIAIRESFNAHDKEAFDLYFENVEIMSYLTNCILGARHYLLKENPESLPRSRRLLKVLWTVDKLVSVLFYAFLLWMLVKSSDTAKDVLDYAVTSVSQVVPFFRNLPQPGEGPSQDL